MKYYNNYRIYEMWTTEYEEVGLEKTVCTAEADIVIIGVTSTDLSIFPKAKYVVCPCTNTNHISNPNNIKIISLEGEKDFLRGITSTAEHTFRLMLDLMRPINQNWRLYKRPLHPGRTLKDKKLGIIGYGRVGKQVSNLARAFDMSVITCDIKNKNFKAQLKNILVNCDIITIHASIEKNQKPILGINELTKLKKGAYLINTSRGEAIDERALLAVANDLSGIALDVVINDDFAGTELRSINHCIFTNHIGGYTIEDLEKTFRFCIDKLLKEIK